MSAHRGKMNDLSHDELKKMGLRARPSIDWTYLHKRLLTDFGFSDRDDELVKYEISQQDLFKAYEMMQLCRQFDDACTEAYMQGEIRGYMHPDSGQEAIPALIADCIKRSDKKLSDYRAHTHALASGVSPDAIMAEKYGKDGGMCHGSGGSMHIYDKKNNFQGGWALVAEQLPYATGAARSILLDRMLRPDEYKDDDRIAVMLVGDGGAQNGRMAECLNAAAKDKLPLLFLVIDNGRAINTFTPDVAANSDVYLQGKHYGVPGLKVDGSDVDQTLRAGRAVVDYVRHIGPAILQVHTYRLHGHSPVDPEKERGRQEEKEWARAEADPIKLFEQSSHAEGLDLEGARKAAQDAVKRALQFARDSPAPPAELAQKLAFPDPPGTDYNARDAAADAAAVTERTVDREARETCEAHVASLQQQAADGEIQIADAVNLAILEEMLRDPTVVCHAEDLQAGSAYNIPKLTQQTFGVLRASDEIINEGHFMGKAMGEAINGYRPIVELMHVNFGVYAMAEMSSAANTYSTTGGQYQMPLTIIGSGGAAPDLRAAAEHSQPVHAYIMAIPGLKIGTAASPGAAYGMAKSMIRDNGPCFLLLPVNQMQGVKGHADVGRCLPIHTCEVVHRASDDAVAAGKAVTVLTYLHGLKEVQGVLGEIQQCDGLDVDLIELRSLKPLDMETIHSSLARTHKAVILDESTISGGVGATVSALIHEQCFHLLDAPVRRLAMEDIPVPYASSMERVVVKRGADVKKAVIELAVQKAGVTSGRYAAVSGD